MKSVLISIRLKWCELIASGEKTVEVRKTVPKIETPFKCYVYETQSNVHYSRGNGKSRRYFSGGKVIGEFVCDKIHEWKYDYCDGVDIDDDLLAETMLEREDINIYASGKTLYGWHISDLKIYDKPKEINEFKNHRCAQKYSCVDCCLDCKIKSPPQSWCYVE